MTLKYKQARNNAAVANMIVAPSQSTTTPAKIQPRQNKDIPQSESPQTAPGRFSAEARAKRKTDDGDDEDGEYTPGKSGKRRRHRTEDWDDEPSLTRSKTLKHGRSAVLSSDESPIIRSVEHRGDALPRRSQYKRLLDSSVSTGTANLFSAPIGISHSPPLLDQSTPTKEAEGNATMVSDSQRENLCRSRCDLGRYQAERTPSPSAFPLRRELDREDAGIENEDTTIELQGTVLDQVAQERAQPSNPRTDPKPEIRYYIISRTPQWSEQHWPDGCLGDRSTEAMFSDVEKFTSKQGIEHIDFKLMAAKIEVKFTIPRRDIKLFEVMKKRFSAKINASLAMGDTDFEIELEVDPHRGEAEAEIGESYAHPGFSF